jgi:hypothetical protein
MNKMLRTVGILLIVLTLLTACAVGSKNVYETNATVEAQVVTLMERYEMYYQLADENTQAEWRDYFDPMFERLDLAMNTYNQMVADGMDTITILQAIDSLKTQIMIELIRRNQENGE